MGVLTLMGNPLPVVFATSLLLSLRFVPMSLSLGRLLDEPSRWRRALAGCLLADASFALLARLGQARPAYLLGTWVIQWGAWILGTALGTLASPLVPAGVLASASDALVAAIFGVLAVEACADRRQALVAVAAGAAALGASWALAVR
jgi:predicted branched-subunit amino acid permease